MTSSARPSSDGEVLDVAPAFSESDLQLDPQHITRTSRVISDLKLIVVLCPMLGWAVAGLVPAGCDDDALRRWREVSDRSVDVSWNTETRRVPEAGRARRAASRSPPWALRYSK